MTIVVVVLIILILAALWYALWLAKIERRKADRKLEIEILNELAAGGRSWKDSA